MRFKEVIFTLTLGSGLLSHAMPAEAAMYLARVVSRANCLVPLPKLSLVQSGGYTFNESISWDPRFWSNHRAVARSNHYRSVFWGGLWTDYLINSFTSGNFNSGTWRVWAGKIDRGDTRELPNPYRRPVRFVSGEHWEILDGTSWAQYLRTGATDCNITTW